MQQFFFRAYGLLERKGKVTKKRNMAIGRGLPEKVSKNIIAYWIYVVLPKLLPSCLISQVIFIHYIHIHIYYFIYNLNNIFI